MSGKKPGREPDSKQSAKRRKAIRSRRAASPKPAELRQQEREPGVEEEGGADPGKRGGQP